MCSFKAPSTLNDALVSNAGVSEIGVAGIGDPPRGVTFFGADRQLTHVSYAQLLDRSRRWLWHLTQGGVRPGDEVLIVTDDLPLFTTVFWACVLGGIVAVPVSTPTNDEGALKIARIRGVLRRPWIVSDARVHARLAAVADGIAPERTACAGERSIAVPGVVLDCPAAPVASVAASDVAFIQFSSGSTGAPKGVIVTHANLIANCTAILKGILANAPGENGEAARLLSWMPLTHDFGLIWFHILPTVFGLDHGLVPTKLFVRNPLVWMQAASDMKASVLGGPNFSYRHFLKHFDAGKPRDWDLSPVRVIANGAEPISCELAEEFTAALAPCGLDRGAMTAAYGLAEGTLVVSMAQPGAGLGRISVDRNRVNPGERVAPLDEGDDAAVSFADVGTPLDCVSLRVVDEAGLPCADDVVGRLQITGASVTAGYYNDDEATRAAFTADGWLDTGDLGFMRAGRLVVTGRRKDVIIVNGVNYYPQDIERVAGEAEGLDLNMVVAGAIPRGVLGEDREGVVLFVLFRREVERFLPLAREVRDRVLREIGIPVDRVIPVARIAKTTSGKVQRFQMVGQFVAGAFDEALRALDAADAAEGAALRRAWERGDEAALVAELAAWGARIVPGGALDPGRPLMESGFTSLRLVELMRRIGRALSLDLPVTLAFEQPTLAALAGALVRLRSADAAPAEAPRAAPAAERARIGITGLACRLPGGVESPAGFWRLLEGGVDATAPVAPGRWPAYDASLTVTDRGGYLADIETFPARFFNLTQVEADAVDPQQRLLLMTAWEALEHAGIDPLSLKGSRTGVFVGISPGDYVQAQARAGRLDAIGPHAFLGSATSVAAGRIAYVLGLEGPALAVDTACSSALAALHLAVRALRAGECDRALVAGVNLILGPEMHVGLSRMNALSPAGRCRAFDAAADGYARGEGCVTLVLERLDAGDAPRPLALVRGTGLNHDGASNGLTAPNGAAQRAVIAAALADAGLAPADVDYVEAHGTGTPLGDPIEAMALAEAYGAGRDGELRVGSVKTNIGHLEAAAGLAGLAKAVLALRHGSLPASLHFETPNPLIPWPQLPLRVVDRAEPWPAVAGRVRRAGVSAFGMSGTNAHVIIEEAPPAPVPAHDDARATVLPVSARTPEECAALAERYAAALERADSGRMHDLARTAACGRAAMAHRLAVTGRDPAELAAKLRAKAAAGAGRPDAGAPVVFLLPGQGAHAPEAVRALHARERVFRETLDAADAALEGFLDRRLTDLLLSPEGAPLLGRTAYNQPATVAVSLAVAAMLRAFGVRPDAVIGHSAGEIAAAALAGMLDLPTAVRFAAARGAAMQALDGGAMIAVRAPAQTINDVIAQTLARVEGVGVAAWNAPARVTLSGPREAVARAAAVLREAGARVAELRVAELDVSHAFHSPMMDGALAPIRELAAGLTVSAATGRMISTLTGGPVDAGALRDPAYWARQAREPVAFAAAVSAVGGDAPDRVDPVLIDLGARPVLAPLAAEVLPQARCLAVCDARRPDERLIETLGELFEAGRPVAWPAVFAERPGRLAEAPTYPFIGKTRVLPTAGADSRAGEAQAAGRAEALPVPAATAPVAGREAVAHVIRSVLRGVAGLQPEEVAGDATWFSLGLDSLLIVQLQQALAREYAIDLPLAAVMENGDTLDRLVTLVVERLPRVAQAPVEAPVMETPAAAAAGGEGVEGLLARQIDAMSALFSQQLALLQGGVRPAVSTPAAIPDVAVAGPAPAAPKREIKGLFKALPARREQANPAQEAHVRRLAAAFNARTRSSKEHTAAYRGVYANPRAVIGFRPEWKELNYPLHVERAEGPYVWDIDGHRYVDITMGFGVTLFGHNPPFVREALAAELAAGFPVGPQSARAGRVAAMISAMTGVERVALFTTGSEAVMVALRLARAKTGRRKIVTFVNSYHGTFDGVLAVGWTEGARVTTMPVSEGTPQGMVDDVIVLRYGDPAALDVIRQHLAELAAVVVEPVQSRDPAVQPRAFLHELRALTAQAGVALVFDETITGFRVHPGGAQRHFGIEADIVTYGKVVGGGMPIGVVSGRRHYLDGVDGGDWQYGDDSVPSARTAFVAGTFNNHPLTAAAAEAVLKHLAAEGPQLQERLNARTAAMCAELDALFAAEDVPVRMAHFSSLFRFEFAGDTEILNYHLLNNGVFVWEGRNCFLSTAHSDDDIRFIVEAVRKGIAEMRAGGWLPPSPGRAAPEARQEHGAREEAGPAPLGRGQGEMLALLEARPEATLAYNEMVAFALDGPLDREALRRAFAGLVRRHEALRCAGIDETGWRAAALPPADLPAEEPAEEGAVMARLARELETPFDLQRGPLMRALLLRLAPQRHVVAFTVHHIVADGWSLGLMAGELAALYAAERAGVAAALPPAESFRAFVAWTQGLDGGASPMAEDSAPVVLPAADFPHRASFRGGRVHRRLSAGGREGEGVFDAARRFARAHDTSPFTVLLAAYALLLGRLSDQRRLTIGIPVAGHTEAGLPVMVGQASAVLPLTLELDPQADFAALVAHVKAALADARHGVGGLFTAQGGRGTDVNVLFNLDRGFRLDFEGLGLTWISPPVSRPKKDLFLNVLELNGEALLDLDHDGALGDSATAERWLDSFLSLLAEGLRAPATPIARLPLSAADRAAQADDVRTRDGFGAPAAIGTVAPVEARDDAGLWADTGRLGRLRADGGVEVLGEARRFLRTRGGWLDLDLPARVLREHPALADAAVIAESGGLTAFVTPRAGGQVDGQALAAYAALRLPPEARPAAFVVTDIARDAGGRALLRADHGERLATRALTPARTDAEKAVAAIWAEVLGLEEVGVLDSFFDLGGHSLKALAILARVEARLGRTVRLRAFFEEPTVAGLASRLGAGEAHAVIPTAAPAAHYPASNAQARLWMLDRIDPGLAAYNIGFSLRSAAPLDETALRIALAGLAGRHESLRTALIDHDGLPRQTILPALQPELRIEDAVGADAAALVARERAIAAEPFALERAPLWRAVLLRGGQGDIEPAGDRLVFVLHHAIADVWSVGVFVRDFLALYAEAGGARLPALALQYRDYAVWQVGRPEPHLDWWVAALADAPRLELRPDRPRPPLKTFNGDHVVLDVPGPVAAALKALAAVNGASAFTAVVAALCNLLWEETEARDIVIGTVTAGRDHPALADQIGFFVNTLALRARVAPEAGFLPLLAGVRDALLAAAEHGDTPLDRVVEALNRPRDPARNPLFEVVVVMDDREEIDRLLAGTGFALAEIDTATAQFDLTLYVTDGADGIRIKATYNTDLFDRARIEGLMARLAGLMAGAAADPARALAARAQGGRAAHGSAPGQRQGYAPSRHQERLWFVDHFERGVLYPSGPTYYNMPFVVRVDGAVDAARLAAAAAALAARHEALRAALVTQGDRPAVEVAAAAALPVAEIAAPAGAGLAAVEEASRAAFDLDTPPLARLTLCREAGSGACWLALTVHHAMGDRAALRTLAEELARLYADPAAALPEIRPFGAAHALPERAVEAGHEADAAYWREALAGVSALVLPTDRPRPAIHTFTAGRVAGRLDAALRGRIDALAAALGVSRADVLRAGYQALLHRLSGQRDVVIGETVQPPQPARTVGPLANLLPLRLDVEAGEGFAALVRRAAARRQADAAHGAIPFDLLVLAVKPRNDMSRTALFDVLFHHENATAALPAGWAAVDTGLGWGKYDFVLSVVPDGDGLAVSLVYNRDLFDAASAQAVHARYGQLLAAALAQPERPLSALDIMLPGERAALLAEAGEVADYPRGLTLTARFEEMAARHGARIAVTDTDGELTYAALDARANRLAHRLRALGAGPEALVGLFVGRTWRIPAGILGILKAGAGYVPIDPAYPDERIRFMVADSGMRLIVTDAENAAAAHRLGIATVVIDDLAEDLPVAATPENAAPENAAPENVAYVIYTSGSTGMPKGCVIEHRNVIQLFFHEGRPFAFGPDDVWSLFHSACFDFSTWEIYGALLFGGRLVVVPQALTREPAAFLELVAREGVTVLSQTPTAFYGLIEAARQRPGLHLALREIVFGGEALAPARLAPWRALHPAARLVNMYGITETTVHVTFREIGDAEIAEGRSVIGRPLPSCGVLLVGPDLAPCPRGVAGEIVVAGHGVARRYLNRPELTAERFIAHPDLPGGRVYRSGDLGRIGLDGELVYLGRMDDQVKIRGFRIEPGEIERRLVAHPAIRDAAVLAEGGEGGEGAAGESLCACVVTDAPPGREELFHYLADKLPDYMIPSRFLRVARIPLTANGKADRRRLAAEGGEAIGAGGGAEEGRAPRTPLQKAVARIWCEVLGVPQVGLDDNFFALGGHSLKANQVVVRIRQRLGGSLDLRDFFSAQTLAVLVELIERRGLGAAGTIAPAPSAPDYPLSFAQRRLWLVQNMNPDRVAYNMAGAFVVEGAVDRERLAAAFRALAVRHEILRTRFVSRHGEPRQVVDAGIDGHMAVFEAGHDAGSGGMAAVERLLAAELRHVFDLARGPLARVHLAELPVKGHGGCAIIINLHHIVSDGWSVTVMLRELEALYRAALAAPQATPAEIAARAGLPALPVQYRDYALWQHGEAAGEGLRAARSYWLARFEDEAPALELPADRPRPHTPGGAGAIVHAVLDEELTQALRDLARRHDMSLFGVLAALVRVQLALLSGQDDITIGTPVAGRNLLELEGQIGFYLNLLALRGRIGPQDAFGDVLKAERTLVLDAFAHEACPFDLLVGELGVTPERGRHPLFDVLIILQNNEPVRLDLAGSRGAPLRDTSISAKYDLNYMFEDRPALELLLEYAADLFDADTARRIAGDFVALARAVAADPSIGVDSLRDRMQRAVPPPDAPAADVLAHDAAHGAAFADDGW
ncbi:MAG: amino acid adenylation domain-containing protein [Pseudochelatococcus sp.]|jgi:iturin family lipopeptide synthetase A|uniref:amino acid adenylation domain-containing protein n=1 Tax=Pseudochelatococcus sp. TaxID=2020869 RepID=UPI003D8C3A42